VSERTGRDTGDYAGPKVLDSRARFPEIHFRSISIHPGSGGRYRRLDAAWANSAGKGGTFGRKRTLSKARSSSAEGLLGSNPLWLRRADEGENELRVSLDIAAKP